LALLRKTLKEYLFFTEPDKPDDFVLEEGKDEGNESCNDAVKDGSGEKREKTEKVRKSKGVIKKLFTPEREDTACYGYDSNADNSEKNESDVKKESKDPESIKRKTSISKDVARNLEYMRKVYNVPLNGDVVIREFEIAFKDKTIPAFSIFFDGLVDRMLVNESILKPLMLLSNIEIKGKEDDIADYVQKHILPQSQMLLEESYEKVIFGINYGCCAIFIDGVDKVFVADAKGWEHRGIERPNAELVIQGPQEGFGEILRINTALIRKILKDEKLIVEDILIGERSKTPCSMLYIKDIVNDSLVQEVRRRLKGVKIDHLIDSGELEQLIEDSTYLPTPQVIYTERPDRVSRYLANGRIAIIVSGSPFALVVPATMWNLFHATEDEYVRFPYANLLRVVRLFAIFLTLLLPGIYIAITNYHHEMIPTDLLLAIEASREKVPFPSVFELLIMEVSFELIREAGIRIPGPIGPTLGIIGALILGQAAVSANIVSPILIIIVAVTGIGSFAIPNFSLAYSFRLQRFAYIALGATAGFLGISFGLFIMFLWIAKAKSFGVPVLVPYGPTTADVNKGNIFRNPTWKQNRRPDDLNVKSKNSQQEISRQWKINEEEN